MSQAPVFHRSRGWDGKKVQGTVITIPAVCGLPLDVWDRESGRRWFDSTSMLRSHAGKFGRPCSRCWKGDPAYPWLTPSEPGPYAAAVAGRS